MTPANSHWVSVARALRVAGVTRVYGVPGDDMAAVGELRLAGINLIVTSEQRTAAYAAAGDARVSLSNGRQGIGIVIAGRGPGAAALVPPLLELASGGSAVVALVGGPPHGASSRSFQFAPQREMLEPLVKLYQRVSADTDVEQAVLGALATATAAPAGPVVIEIPDAFDRGEHDERTGSLPIEHSAAEPLAAVTLLPQLIADAQRPVVLVGAGARGEGASVVEFAHVLGAPLLSTASGRGVVDERDPSFWGLSGLYLHPVARRALDQADLLIAIGSRLEETATEHLPPLPILRIDIDPWFSAAANETVLVSDVSVVGSWTAQLAALDTPRGWGAEITRVRESLHVWRDVVGAAPAHLPGPRRVGAIVAAIAKVLPRDVIVCHENGAADMWSYLFPVFQLPSLAIDVAPSEQTTLGFGVAAAIGAAHASPHPVFALCGDGAFSMVAQDRALAGPRAPGVVYVVFDNGGHGWLALQDRAVNSEDGEDFVGLGELKPHDGRGKAIPSQKITSAGDVAKAVKWALEVAQHGPAVLLVPCLPEEGAPVLGEEW